MGQAFFRGVSLALAALFTMTISGADTWRVRNNLNKDFRLELRSSGAGEARLYDLPAGRTVPIRLGEDNHTIVTELLQGTNKQRQRSDEISLRDIADEGETLLKNIRSPIDIRMPDGEGIYQAMDDFPYSEKYEALINSVRRSQWSGAYGGRKGNLTLNGNRGSADDNTRLNNIQYVPSEDQLVVAGEWEHRGEDGEFILIIDTNRPRELKGHYRTNGQRRWYSGDAKRR
jgi:hypothetical protein